MSPWWKKTTEEGQLEGPALTSDPNEREARSSTSEAGEVTAASLIDLTEAAPDEAQDNESDTSDALTILEEKELEDKKKAEAKKEDESKPRTRASTTRRGKAEDKDDDAKSGGGGRGRSRKSTAKKGSTKKASTKKAAAKKTPKKSVAKRSTARGDAAGDDGGQSRRAKSPAPEFEEPAPTPASPATPPAADPVRQLSEALREILSTRSSSSGERFARERRIALFCDLENVALGVRDSDEVDKFDIDLVLERLLEKGKIIVKKAYADWQRYSEFKRPLHTAGIELIDIPQKYYSGKNSADIKMVVDALDVAYSNENLDTIVLLSGDSDFTPLVSKLKEYNKHVIAVGVKNSSSKLLVDNCDEFIYYEDIWRDSLAAPQLEGLDEKTAEAFSLMNDAIQALVRENKTVLWGSMIKQTMQRKRPSFNEGYYGYKSFSHLLEDAEKKKIIHLKKDSQSGGYIVTGFAQGG
ncbi:MAG: NYN domain-containing protein [Thermoanaerobaculia bacterium]|nr:NYN domain-containing protein [Thermoanaerobaculia bacterium]